jgi:hypothetical protein
MHSNPALFKTRMHSIELWKDGQLVAGELGYTVGDTYTSQTGEYQPLNYPLPLGYFPTKLPPSSWILPTTKLPSSS